MSMIMDDMATGTTRYFQPTAPIASRAMVPGGVDNAPDTGMDARLAKLVGLVALGLPVAMAMTPLLGGCFRDSISHHYYEPLTGPVFVGMLAFIGAFLIAYRGEHWLENRLATLAGLGAFGVAVLPTTRAGCEQAAGVTSRIFAQVTAEGQILPDPAHGPCVLFPGVEGLHGAAAAVVFGFLALFVLVVLRRVYPPRHVVDGRIIPTKRARNILYSVAGGTILLCIAVLGLKTLGSADFTAAWNRWNLTFWVEALALWAFALAWLAKGRQYPALNDPA